MSPAPPLCRIEAAISVVAGVRGFARYAIRPRGIGMRAPVSQSMARLATRVTRGAFAAAASRLPGVHGP